MVRSHLASNTIANITGNRARPFRNWRWTPSQRSYALYPELAAAVHDPVVVDHRHVPDSTGSE